MNLRLDGLAQQLQTPRLTLRAFTPSDAHLLFELVELNRAHLERWLVWSLDKTSPEAIAEWAARPYDASEAYRMGVYLSECGTLLGAAGLKVRRVDPGSTWSWVDVNYWLSDDATGFGYATEAARYLAVHAFDDLESPRVEIRTEPGNERSVRVATRLGFRHEGTLRSVGHRRGGPIDLAVYALLARERGVLRATGG